MTPRWLAPITAWHGVYLLAITSNPFRFGSPARMGDIIWEVLPLDVVANLILMAPLGLALRALTVAAPTVIGVGFFTSVAIEALQLLNSRASSVIDVGLNTIGIAIVALWPGLDRAPLRRALLVTPALWSLGLLWPQLPLGYATAILAALLAIGVDLGGRWHSAPMAFAAWAVVSLAPTAAHAPFVAAAALAGSVGLMRSTHRLEPPWRTGLLVTVGATGAAIVAANPVLAWPGGPPTLWQGHAWIWLATVMVAAIADILPGWPKPIGT